MTATLDRMSEGRLLINVVTGGDPAEAEGDGVFLSHDERYAADRRVPRCLAARAGRRDLDFTGKHVRVKGAKVLYPPVQKPLPPLYFGGSSAAAHELAARRIDVYLTWGEPPARSPRRSPISARALPRRVARSASGSACMSSSARPTRRPGQPPTI